MHGSPVKRVLIVSMFVVGADSPFFSREHMTQSRKMSKSTTYRRHEWWARLAADAGEPERRWEEPER